MIWNQSLNILLSQFSPLMICSVINLQDLRLNSEQKTAKVSSWLSIFVFAALMIALILIFIRTRNLVVKLS